MSLNERQEIFNKFFIKANLSGVSNKELENEKYPLYYREHYKKQRELAIKEFGKTNIRNIFSLRELEIIAGNLFNSKIFKIQEKERALFLNTDIDFNFKKHLPFGSVFLDCDLEINGVLIKGLLLIDYSNKDNKNNNNYFIENIKDLEICFVMFKDEQYMGCSFFINKQDIVEGGGVTEGTNELSNIFLNVDFRKQISMFVLNYLKFLYNPEVEMVYKEYSDTRKKRKAQEGKLVENHYYLRVKGKLREYLDELDIEKFTKEYQRHTNSWVVRGYYKKLGSDFYKNKKGQEIYVTPFVCGLGSPKKKEYILGEKKVWKNQLLMIETVKKVLRDRIVLENTRGILGGLELDCYIPDNRIGFEYDGKQHFKRVEYFQREEKDFKEQLKRDKEKDNLCKKLGIKLIRIKYDEEITEELIQNKLFELNTLKIVKIEDAGECDTYDIMVEDNNNFYLENNINSDNSGKSVSTKSIIEGYHDNLFYKVWDFYGGERHEGIYWVFPSQDKQYWDRLKSIGNFNEEGPKQYKCNLLFPHFASTLPKKLPFKEGYITSKVFTIPLKKITSEDIKDILGTISDTSGYVWNEIVNKATKKDTCAVLDDLSKMFGGSNTLLQKKFITPLKRERFIMNEDCSSNLDLKAEADDREAITILCLEFVPKQFHLFVMNYLLRTLNEMIDINKIKKKNIVFIREAASFFRVNDDIVMDENLRIFRVKLSNYIRMGRRGMHFCLSEDTKIKTVNQKGEMKENTIKEQPSIFNVLSYNFNSKELEIDKAKKKYMGKKNCFEIFFENDKRIIATPEHKFFNETGKEVKVEDLKVGDKLSSL